MSDESMNTPQAPTGLPQWAYVQGVPSASAVMRRVPEDFIVDEWLGFEPDGEGDHAMLQVRKRNTNTDWLARELAKHAGVQPVDIGFAGLKDRIAVTTQWFTVNLAGKQEPDWASLNSEEIEILTVARHRRKLKRGSLRGNHFCITLRDVQGDRAELEQRLQRVQREGVPNYFGEQRFGREGGNIERARRLFEGRFREKNRTKRGLYLSAARSLLFNEVLSARVAGGSWHTPLPGDVMILDGRRGAFTIDAVDEEITRRLADGEIHPTGPLWGRGRLPTSAEVQAIEDSVLEGYCLFKEGLERAGMEMERRALRLLVKDLRWNYPDEHSLQLEFSLNSGSYATAVLRELVRVDGQEETE